MKNEWITFESRVGDVFLDFEELFVGTVRSCVVITDDDDKFAVA